MKSTLKNIFKVFKRDLKKIFTNSMAIILVVGITALPSLYAWFNIYANWDPYGKTGSMQVAVANCDEGTFYKDIKISIGDSMVSNLKGNNSINWQFVSKEEAIHGVEAGEYYAAIEIPEGFSKNLASIVTSDYEKPQIVYYANEKKNAIATKITDKVVQTVQLSVNESFITTVVTVLNTVLGTALDNDEATGVNSFDYLKDEVSQAQDSLSALQNSVNSFSKLMKVMLGLNTSLDQKDMKSLLESTGKLVDDTKDTVEVTQNTVSSMLSSMGSVMTSTGETLDSLSDTVRDLSKLDYEAAQASITVVSNNVGSVKNAVDEVIDVLTSLNNGLTQPIPEVTSVINQLKTVSKSLGEIKELLDGITITNMRPTLIQVADKLSSLSKTLTSIESDYSKNIQPKLKENVTSLLSTLTDLSKIIESVNKDTPQLNTMSDTLNESVGAGDDMITTLSKMLSNMNTQLGKLYDSIDALSNSEIVNAIVNITGENAGDLGEFIASPVSVKTEKVYGIENYGSAMAPFYSTLAIWVGAIMVSALIKTEIKKRKEIAPKLKNSEKFWGRGLLYLAIAAVQSSIICLGDLYFLKIQCYHPIKFLLVGVVAGIVYSLFIYSLVYTFGDIGKAVGVILLVIQIGGSGGTFPIDVTPSFFVTINPYLPFTFVIEAMRECVCGLYENNYWIYILKLLAYAVAAFIIAFPIKAIVKKPIRFFEKRVEETDLF